MNTLSDDTLVRKHAPFFVVLGENIRRFYIKKSAISCRDSNHSPSIYLTKSNVKLRLLALKDTPLFYYMFWGGFLPTKQSSSSDMFRKGIFLCWNSHMHGWFI